MFGKKINRSILRTFIINRLILINFALFFTCTQFAVTEPDIFKAVAYHTHGSQNASQFFQTLGKEAYILAGLPKNQSCTIKCFAPQSPFYNTRTPACNCNGEVFVQQNSLEKEKDRLGIIRLTLLHEMTHRRQFDKNIGNFCVLNPKLYTSIEKEADIEAAYRGNCSLCTLDYAQGAYSKNDTNEKAQKNRAAGYATREELLAIAEQQKKCHALCKHHNRLTNVNSA